MVVDRQWQPNGRWALHAVLCFRNCGHRGDPAEPREERPSSASPEKPSGFQRPPLRGQRAEIGKTQSPAKRLLLQGYAASSAIRHCWGLLQASPIWTARIRVLRQSLSAPLAVRLRLDGADRESFNFGGAASQEAAGIAGGRRHIRRVHSRSLSGQLIEAIRSQQALLRAESDYFFANTQRPPSQVSRTSMSLIASIGQVRMS